MMTPIFRPRTLVAAFLVWIVCGPSFLVSKLGAQMAPYGKKDPTLENYDIRDTAAPGSTSPARATYRSAQLVGPRADAVTAKMQSMAQARAALRATLPTLQVEESRFGTTVPEGVGTTTATQFLTANTSAPHEETLRGFLGANAALYGLTAEEAAGLVKFSDYANPAGNLSWVGMKQEINGLPVFQGEILAAFTPDGALARTTGNLGVGLDAAALTTTPGLTPVQATVQAAATIGRTIKPGKLTLNSTEAQGRISYVSPGPFARETKTELMYFPLEPGVGTLAYAMVLWDQPRAYYVLVDADSGTLLFRKCITQDQTQTVTYNVYTGDSPSPLSPSPVLPGQGTQAPGVARQSVTLVADDLNASPLGWITDSTAGASVTTTGNNCDAGLDAVSPDGIEAYGRPTSTSRTFNFTYNPPPLGTDQATSYTTVGTTSTITAYASGAVTNLFFWTNRYHDRLYNLGFTEAARNFQKTNTFTLNGTSTNRGGVGNDAVSAQVHDNSGTDNANFGTPPDGSPGVMQMYLFTDASLYRDGALDGDVFLHEMTHGLSNRLHANGSGLAINQSGGMGEGWSDFYARCLLSGADENVDGVFASGGYVTYKLGGSFTDNYYYGIRRFPYSVISSLGANGKPNNPETFADVDPAQINLSDGAYAPSPLFGTGSATEVHNIGEVWCSMLLEVRERFIKRLGYDTGNTRALQVVTDAMKLDVASPTMVQARNSIIAADNAGYGGADITDIRTGFAARGMGAGASTDGTSVVESFAPELALGSVTFSDSLGNGNGVAEPGEDLLIIVPLTNVGTVAENATASVGTYTASYSLAANNGSVTQTIPYRVPASTALGSNLTIPVVYTGLYGTYTYNFKLTVGNPVYSAAFTQTFDGVTAPALPSGWTTTTETATGGVAGTAWKTVTSPVVDSANSAFAPDLNGNNTAGGGSSLVSPAVTLPIGTPQLTFKHTYLTEATYDGCVLEISIAGGAFTDIVAAGGSITSNGYNGTIDSNYGNPLAGRNAWTGSATAATVLVSPPTSALGKSVQFRWRLGFDNYYAPTGGGWYVDSIRLITGYTAAPIDTDGDGLQDGYERAHGLNPNDPTDAAKDSDGDGVSNLQEYLAGTDPQNAASVFKITQATRDASGNLTLVFPSVMGKVYTCEYKNALTDSAWTSPGATYNGTGGNLTLSFSPADLGNGTARFYRIRVVNP